MWFYLETLFICLDYILNCNFFCFIIRSLYFHVGICIRVYRKELSSKFIRVLLVKDMVILASNANETNPAKICMLKVDWMSMKRDDIFGKKHWRGIYVESKQIFELFYSLWRIWKFIHGKNEKVPKVKYSMTLNITKFEKSNDVGCLEAL